MPIPKKLEKTLNKAFGNAAFAKSLIEAYRSTPSAHNAFLTGNQIYLDDTNGAIEHRVVFDALGETKCRELLENNGFEVPTS